MLRLAIKRAPRLIDQPNFIGQTPLHLSVRWPKGMEVLLKENANIYAVDYRNKTAASYAAHHNLIEPLRLLGKADCGPLVFNGQYSPWSLLDEVMENQSALVYREARGNQDSVPKLDAILSYTVSLLSERRRSLKNLVVSSLTQSSIRKLTLSSNRVLDHNAALAIAMLQEVDVDVHKSLSTTKYGQTVYHGVHLNQRHARSLWQAGFRNVSQLDDSGRSPLMVCRSYSELDNLEPYLKLVAWLVSNGASLHCLQGHTFRTGNMDRDYDSRCVKTNADSSIMAVHYVGLQLGVMFCSHLSHSWDTPVRNWGEGDIELLSNRPAAQRLKNKKRGQSLHSQLNSHTPASQALMRDALGDSLGDSCLCPCSSNGCLALTMIFKGLGFRFWNAFKWWTWFYEWDTRRRHSSGRLDVILQLTFGLAELLQIGKSEMGQIRSELFRFQLFEILKLRHTCCTMGSFNHNYVIAELGDEEDW